MHEPAGTAPWPTPPSQAPGLAQCIVLAMLLHILLVLVFGSAPGGSARLGEGAWGRLNVTLAGAGPAAESGAAAVADAYTGPQGTARQERWGGLVRDSKQPLPQAQRPGAATVGTWNAEATGRAAGMPAASPTEVAPPLSTSPRELPAPLPPAARTPVIEARSGPKIEPAGPAPAEAPTPPPTPTLLTAPDAAEMPMAQAPTAAPALRTDTAAAALPLPAAAAIPATAAPESVPAVPVSIAPLSAALPMPVPSPVPAPVPAPEPVALPTAAAAVAPAIQPLPVVAPAAPRTEPVDGTMRHSSVALPNRSADKDAMPAAAPRAMTPAELNLLRGGAPDAGARLGRDVATPPALPSSAPRLNLELPRPRGGEISRQASGGLLQLLPHPPERKSKLAEGLENATKPDCRKAYGGLGLLAAVPLAIDAVRDSGCRW